MLNFTVHPEIPVFLKPEYSKKQPDHKQNARVAINRSGLACPAWLTSEDHESMLDTYRQCFMASRRTGAQYHVDHVIPLKGLLVCGLHVPSNLSVITALDNIVKGNGHSS